MSDSLGDALTNPIAPTITFTQIPSNIETPGNYIEIGENTANIGLLPFPARILLVGPTSPAGVATAAKIYTINSPAQGAALFGTTSALTDMINAVFDSNPTIPVDAISPLPVSFATNATAGQVAITAALPGILGNFYDLRVNPSPNDVTVPGVTIAVAPMAGGTGTPVLTTVFTTIAATWYTDIMFAWNDAGTQGALASYLLQQDNAMVSMDGVGYTCWTGTQGQMAALVATLNSRWLGGIGITNPQNPPWAIGAALLGIAAEQLMNDPARQLRGLVLPGIIAPAPGDQIMQAERNALLLDGIGTYKATREGSVTIDRLVTTYLQTDQGVPDQTWQDIMSTKVMSRIRWDWKNYVSITYPNDKLADDDSLAAEYDPTVATCKRLKGSWAARCRLYEQVGWIENSAATAAASIFVRDPSNRNKVNCKLQVQVIGNLMITAAQLLFDAGS